MAQQRKKMNGAFHYFPDGVSLEKGKKEGEQRIAVSVMIDGKKHRRYFPATEAGLKEASRLAESIRKEKRAYGAEFGAVADDEKLAIDLWRAYRDECMREGCEFKSMSEVMRGALDQVKAISISPTVSEAARLYMEDMSRKNHGESTEHMATVENRLRRIADALGEVHYCNLTDTQINDFLRGLRHPQKGTPAKPATITQYLGLFKGMSRLLVKRGLMEEKKDAARMLEAPHSRRVEPETLSLDEVCRVFEYVRDHPEEHRFLPVLAVGFFCGARVAERCRLRYRDIFPGGRDAVYLSCEITKTNKDRHTYTNGAFRAWMELARKSGVPMHPGDFLLPGETESKRKDAHNRLLKRLATAAGVDFPKNCIRHTAASNKVELEGFSSTANQLGHGEGMLASNYRVAITREEATAYFNISPACCDAARLLAAARAESPSMMPAALAYAAPGSGA